MTGESARRYDLRAADEAADDGEAARLIAAGLYEQASSAPEVWFERDESGRWILARLARVSELPVDEEELPAVEAGTDEE